MGCLRLVGALRSPFASATACRFPCSLRPFGAKTRRFELLPPKAWLRTADPKALPELERAVSVEKEAGVKLAMEFAFTALAKEAPWWTGWARGYMATLPEHT